MSASSLSGAGGRTIHRGHHAEPTQASTRRALTALSHELHRRGWVANHDGNASVRLPGGRYLLTPTAMSKRVLVDSDLIVIDRVGRVLQGQRRPFSEWALHGAVLDARPDVMAVVHAHPPAATALAVMGIEVQPQMLAEAVISIGDRVPMVAYALPGSAAQVAALGDAAVTYDAATLEHHGVFTWGDDVEMALLRMELVEHLASIALRALALGPLRTLPAADVRELLTRRTRAGLGAEARTRRP